jgi:hypothetical protein
MTGRVLVQGASVNRNGFATGSRLQHVLHAPCAVHVVVGFPQAESEQPGERRFPQDRPLPCFHLTDEPGKQFAIADDPGLEGTQAAPPYGRDVRGVGLAG